MEMLHIGSISLGTGAQVAGKVSLRVDLIDISSKRNVSCFMGPSSAWMRTPQVLTEG